MTKHTLIPRPAYEPKSPKSPEPLHVVPRANGGKDNIENLLPACKACNGLRWFRKGTAIHRIMLLGILAVEEIDKKSDVGSKMDSIYAKRKKTNVERRLKRLLSKSQS